ncbi:MAG: hypothetical protein AAF514_04955 [Verrucomicrobiota bacterium]
MNRAVLTIGVFALFAMAGCKPAATYKIDTVRFVPTKPIVGKGGPVPGIWINTNTRLSSLFGGTMKSHKPYGLGIDYTDSTFSFAQAELLSVNVVYDDGTIDPGGTTLNLPFRIAARNYESTNSVGGGRIVKSTVRIISSQLPGVISRDEPFTLKIEGQFTKDDGSRIPFAIDRHYDIQKDHTTRSAAEVLQDA